MLAALVLASCSQSDDYALEEQSYDQVVGTRVGEISTNSAILFRRYVTSGNYEKVTLSGNITLSSELVIEHDITIASINGSVITSSAPITCKANVRFEGIEIDATTSRGTGAIQVSAENINVVLNNTTVKQNTAGTADDVSTVGMGIYYQAYNNSLKLENNSKLILPGNYVRAICLAPAENSTINSLEIKDSKIAIGNDLSHPATYARGVSLSKISTTANVPVLIENSTIEGCYYVVNVVGTNVAAAFDVRNSTLNGRAAFNIWASNIVATIDGCKLIGQNPYQGGWEEFANIMINNNANNCTFVVGNTDFEMYRAAGNPYNSQLAFMTGGTNTTIHFVDPVRIYDYSQLTERFIGSSVEGLTVNLSGIGNVSLEVCKDGASLF